MKLIKRELQKLLTCAVQKVFPAFKGEVKIAYPTAHNFGDYASPVALEIAKLEQKQPRTAAQEILDKLKLPAWIEKTEIAGAGFINFFIKPEFATNFLDDILARAESYGASEAEKGKTIVTDTSHPNIAKPMGVHHLLSTIIGNALNRIFAAVGYKVVRDNYLGDWGTQFGKLIYAYKTWGNEETVKKDPIPELLKLYVKFHEEAEKNKELENFGRAEFKKLEEGDAENKKLWKWVVEMSLKEFQKLYDRLDVSFDFIHGESFYEDKMQEIIDMGIKKGLFVKGEGGALIAPLKDPQMPPCLIKKSDGATLYATRDLARTKYWEDTWHPDLMIMVADTAQTLHFEQFFEVAQALGVTDAKNIHVSFGRMRFPEKKMSTRKGNIILMEELLDEAEELAYKIVCEKNSDLPDKKKKEIARQVGVGAVKYAILAQNRSTDVVFTWEKMLSLEGNSAPYLQYVHARAQSILRKNKKSPSNGQTSRDQKLAPAYVLKEPQELNLARLLPKFPEVVHEAAREFKPNLVANYLFEVATRFNSFYGAVPVIHAESEAALGARLKLVKAASVVLKNGLDLLGIAAPDEM